MGRIGRYTTTIGITLLTSLFAVPVVTYFSAERNNNAMALQSGPFHEKTKAAVPVYHQATETLAPETLEDVVKCLESDLGTIRYKENQPFFIFKEHDASIFTIHDGKLEIAYDATGSVNNSIEERAAAWFAYLSLTKNEGHQELGNLCLAENGLPEQGVKETGSNYFGRIARRALGKGNSVVKSLYESLTDDICELETELFGKSSPQTYCFPTGMCESKTSIKKEDDLPIPEVGPPAPSNKYTRKVGITVTPVKKSAKNRGSDPKDYRNNYKAPTTYQVPRATSIHPSIDFLETCYCGQETQQDRDAYMDEVLSNTSRSQRDNIAERFGRLEDNNCQGTAREYRAAFPHFELYCSIKTE